MSFNSFEIVSALMDIFILKMYLDISLKHRRITSNIFYYSSFVAVETILFIYMQLNKSNQSISRAITTMLFSMVTTYLLCLLYDATTSLRLFAMISFQLLATFAEMFANLGLIHIVDNLYENAISNADMVITFVSKMILFIVVTLSVLFWKKKDKGLNTKLLGTQLVIPLLSLILCITFPTDIYTNKNSNIYLTFFCSCFFAISIYSFWIFDKLVQNEHLRHQSIIANQQLSYQKSKYSQLSSAYKDTRKLIHDTKNHFFYLENCVKNNETEKILPYLHTAISSLESGYITTNTGNLVVDSMVSNLLNVGKSENISIDTEISIDNNKLKIDDYDMCVILGNLIDNSVNAVRKISDPSLRNIHIAIMTDSAHFSVNVVNNYIKEKQNPNLEHGFGCSNVEDVTLKYHGIFLTDSDESKFTSTVIIPLCLMK